MVCEEDQDWSLVAKYDQEAEAAGWSGPEVAFGLAYGHIESGQTILDVGIGTGLGSILFHRAGLQVHGMDVSAAMLDACGRKGFATDLVNHDLSATPYPYEERSMDHCVCVGVMHFFKDLLPVIKEAGRILRGGGVFVFVVFDRKPGEEGTRLVSSDSTGSGAPVTIHCHGLEEISGLLGDSEFELLRNLEFTVYADRRKDRTFAARAYLARRNPG